MQKLSIFIVVYSLAAICRLSVAQDGYAYPSPDNPLAPSGPSTPRPNSISSIRPGSPVTPVGYPSSAGYPSSGASAAGATPPTYNTNAGFPSSGFPSGSGSVGPNTAAIFPQGPSTAGVGRPASPAFASGPIAQFPASGPGSRPSTQFPLGPSIPGANQYPASSGQGSSVRPGQFPSAQIPSVTSAQFPSVVGGGQASIVGGGSVGGDSGSRGGNVFNGQFNDGSYQQGDYSAIPGQPDIDYPIYSEIPQTSFDCSQQQWPGYYADVEARCQVFHICALNKTFDFLCPNGTIFSQLNLVCVWWNDFACDTAPSLYGNNAYIYDYSKTGQPSNGQNGQSDYTNVQQGGQSPSSIGYPGTPQQGPSVNFATAQGPSASYPGAQSQSTNFPGKPSTNYAGARPSGPVNAYPGVQTPSASYSGATGPQAPGIGFPSASATMPGSTGTLNEFPVSAPSAASGTSYPTIGQSPSSGPSGSAGISPPYPIGGQRPTAQFPGASQNPTGPIGGFTSPQQRPSFPASKNDAVQSPTREYLPPIRS